MRTLVFVVAVLAVGCGYNTPDPKEPEFQGQSYPEAMRVMCDVDKLAGISSDEDPLSIGRKRSEWIQQKVENPDGIYLRTLISVKGAAEQAKDLRAEASDCGIATCALADDLEKSGMGGIAP